MRAPRVGPSVLLLLALSLGACDGSSPTVATGTPAPAFVLPRLEGGNAAFPQGYRGRVVAIRFWADWCPYCRSELQALEPVYRHYQDQGLALLAVNIMQPRETVQAYVRTLDSSAEFLLDAHGETTRAYGILGVPVTVFVDREGIVRGRLVGESTVEAFVRIVDPLLGTGRGGDAAPGRGGEQGAR